jgi:class 3 adenylate cyclase
MADDIAQWLDELGLGRYGQAFADNDIEFANLPHLTEDDLKEMGFSIGHRRTFQAAAAMLSSGSVQVARGPAHLPEAERRQLTILFGDLVGSTELATKLDPEDMREVLRAYQDACAQVINRYDGFLAKFMGDGVFAYFGYPSAHEDDPESAINAGLEIVQAV